MNDKGGLKLYWRGQLPSGALVLSKMLPFSQMNVEFE
jgi:hypothetical protein